MSNTVFVDTDPTQIASIVASLRRTFDSQITLKYEWRLKQLLKLQKLMKDGAEELSRAVYLDLHRSRAEADMLELNIVNQELQTTIDHLQEWMTPTKVSTNLLNMPGHSALTYDPRGVALIMAPWNYPIQLIFAPLVGALAAGNTVLLRPGTYSRHTAAAIARLISVHFDPSIVSVATGERAVTTAVLEERFDMIFFTGGPALGRVVHAAANKHLTPVVLELGGKSPALIDSDADLDVSARRLAWASMINLGQTCVRPDHVYVHEAVADRFLAKVRESFRAMYAAGCTDASEFAVKENPLILCKSVKAADEAASRGDVTQSPYLGRIINTAAFSRLCDIIEADKKYIFHGGASVPDQRFIEPTILFFGKDIKAFTDSASMQEELFGPILPVVSVSSMAVAVAKIRTQEKPLALYCFTNNTRTQDLVRVQTSSGSLMFNDAVVQLTNHHLPFGGVGASGMGNYHGFYSFKSFSHEKAVMYKYNVLDLPARYPPYHASKKTILNLVSKPIPKLWLRRAYYFVAVIILSVGFVTFQKYIVPLLIRFLQAIQKA